MNKAYRLVWSGRHGGFVAVPEIACARGKGPVRVCVAALAAASLFMTPACAQVDPATGRTTVTTTAGGVPVVDRQLAEDIRSEPDAAAPALQVRLDDLDVGRGQDVEVAAGEHGEVVVGEDGGGAQDRIAAAGEGDGFAGNRMTTTPLALRCPLEKYAIQIASQCTESQQGIEIEMKRRVAYFLPYDNFVVDNERQRQGKCRLQ